MTGQRMTGQRTIGPAEAPSGRTIAQSAAWRFAEAAGGEGLALLVFVVMARLLVPEQFGVVALAGVVIAAAQVLLTSGLADAIVQGEEAGDRRITTAFWLNLGLALTLMLVVMAAAYPLSSLFAAPGLAPILIALAPILPIAAAAAVLQARFVRRLAFKPIALRVLGATAMGGMVGLGSAVAGAGVWALVGLQLTGAVTGLVVLTLADPWRPKLVFDGAAARSLGRFALPLMGTHLTRFAGKKLDLAILGLFVSTTSLGHYFLATRLIFALGMATHYTVATLTLPVLARLQDDRAALREAAGRTLWLTSALCLPTGLGLALVAEPLVPLVFGVPWQPSVLPLQILAAFGIVYALCLVAGQILVAAGRPALFFRLTLANTALFLALVAAAAPFGLAAVALAGGLANALILPVSIAALERTIGLGTAIREQLPIWVAAAVMTAAVLVVDLSIGQSLEPPLRLALVILTGILTYALSLYLLAASTLAALWASLGFGGGRPIGPAAETSRVS